MKMHARAEMERVGERVGRAPGIGEVAAQIHLVVAFEKATEEEAVDSLGLRIGGKARIEIGGIGFDQEG
jgi:hypothetical protein